MDLNSVITPYFGNRYSLVGVELLDEIQEGDPHPKRPKAFCEAVKEAALEPTNIILDTKDHACPNAELVLGYVEPKYVDLPYRVQKPTKAIRLTNPPNEDSDLVIVIGTAKQMMDMSSLVGGITASFGEEGSFGLCGEAVARVILEGKPSASLFCQGARVLAGFNDSEMVVGLPMDAARNLAIKIQDIEKGCSAMCGCLTSDIPPAIIQSFKEAGFEKSTDFFFGKVNGHEVKIYLDKDNDGRVHKLTVTLLLKGEVPDTDMFIVKRRGNWNYVSTVVDLDSFSADIYTGQNLEDSIHALVEKIIERIKK